MNKIEELLTIKGLYDEIEITINDLEELEKYLSESEYTDNTLDCFCKECGEKEYLNFLEVRLNIQINL